MQPPPVIITTAELAACASRASLLQLGADMHVRFRPVKELLGLLVGQVQLLSAQKKKSDGTIGLTDLDRTDVIGPNQLLALTGRIVEEDEIHRSAPGRCAFRDKDKAKDNPDLFFLGIEPRSGSPALVKQRQEAYPSAQQCISYSESGEWSRPGTR
jgi:hypothetical protein